MRTNQILNRSRAGALILLGAALCVSSLPCCAQAQTPSLSVEERVSAAADEAKQGIQDTSQAALSKFEILWKRIDERRLKHRTPDELVAWVIMGLLVSGVIHRFSRLKQSFTFLLGLAGAFAGGIVAHLLQLDVGLGPVLIRYEDLLCALMGGLLILGVARFITLRKARKT